MDSRTPGSGEVQRPMLFAALGGAWAAVREHRRAYLLAGASVTLLVLALLPFDATLSDVSRQAPAWAHRLSAELATLGRFLRSTGIVGLALVLLGMLSRRRRWRDAGVACLLAGSLAGMASLGLKPIFVRARPDSGLAAGLHWLQGQPDGLRSFPSDASDSRREPTDPTALLERCRLRLASGPELNPAAPSVDATLKVRPPHRHSLGQCCSERSERHAVQPRSIGRVSTFNSGVTITR